MRHRVIGCFLTAAALIFLSAASAPAAENARLKSMKGTVDQRPTPQAAWKNAMAGQLLAEKSAVRTGASSQAIIKWDNGDSVKLNAMTFLEISEYSAPDSGPSKTRLSLNNGSVAGYVRKLKDKGASFTVATPAAIMGVRGTAFICSYDPEARKMTVSAVEDQVYVETAGGETMLTEGFFTTIVEGAQPSDPEPIPDTEFGTMKQQISELKAVDEASLIDEDIEGQVERTLEDVTLQSQLLENAISAGDCPEGACIRGSFEF